MMSEDLTPIERRLRDAYADAAATVQRRDLNPGAPAQPAMPSGRPGRGRLLLSLAAAAAVLLVVIVPLAILRSPHPGAQQHPKVAARTPVPTPTQTVYRAPPPKYLVTLYGIGSGLLEVRNAATGTLTATIKIPIAIGGGYWYALAAQSARTFIASEDVSLPSGTSSYFYRFVIGSRGKVTSINRVGSVVHGAVLSASVTPDGRYVGYLLLANGPQAKVTVVLANLTTGKVVAFWPIPVRDTIVSMSVDADGNALAVSAYTYSHYNFHTTMKNALEHADLVQWTSVLRPATSGTSFGKLRKLLRQAGTLALSPDGGTLYEFVQAGHVTGGSFRDPKPVTFDLAAINARSGAVIFALHTWQAVWADFSPQLALGPAGGYLLIADNTSLASADTATSQYTALPGSIPSMNPYNKFSPFLQGGDIDPLAW